MGYENIDFNQLADELLKQIKNYIDERLKESVALVPAEILKVNSDGTVDVFFPPDKQSIFTKVQNQSIYQDLSVGDQVFLSFPHKNQSSCWVIAKFKKK